ncbi:hypothetical protein EV175_002606 [Coemansia sp. RSA 1933]|nr:hypothetical protein EV175_002606 [Coemansia sp. RSA 1933]
MSELAQLQALPPLQGQERISALEKLTGMTVQDNNASDTAVIIVSCVFLGLTLVLMLYTWANRNYRPIRAKGLKMVTMIYIASIPWIVGDFQVNGVVRIHGVWQNCRAWVVWVRILFSYIFSGLMMLRFLALDRIFNRGKPYRGRAMYVPGILLSVLLLAYCLSCRFVNTADISVYINYYQICNVNNKFRYASVGLMWVPWTVSLVLAFRLRNIEGSFNERYETMAVMALAYMLIIKTTIIHATHPFFVFNRAYRQSETMLDAIAASMIVWVILAHPVYQCMFHHKEYEKRWINKLRFDGQVDKYAAGFKDGGDEITPYAQSGFEDNKSPLDTLRMLSHIDQTVASEIIAEQRPQSSLDRKDSNSEFTPAEMYSADMSVHGGERRQYGRRII